MKAIPSVVLVLVLAVTLAAAPGESWRMKADYVEACSCHLFRQLGNGEEGIVGNGFLRSKDDASPA